MKKLILASVVGLLSTGVMAASTAKCQGSTASNQTITAAAAGGAAQYNLQDLKFRCSNNVFLNYNDVGPGNAMAVGTGSAKGKTAYKGNTNTGSVVANAQCPATGCTGTEAGAAADAAAADATSS